MFNNLFSENLAFYEVISKNTVEPEKPQMRMQYYACALHCWLSKTTCAQTHSSVCAPTFTCTHAHALTHTCARTHTHKYVILLLFHGNSCFSKTPQRYVKRALRVFCYPPRRLLKVFCRCLWTCFRTGVFLYGHRLE